MKNKIFTLILATSIGVLIASCNSGSNNNDNNGDHNLPNAPINIIPNQIVFDNNHTSQTITITNTSSTMPIASPTLQLTAPLSIESTSCQDNIALAPGQACSYTIQTTTTNGGTQNITVQVALYKNTYVKATYGYIHYAYIANGNNITICDVAQNNKLNNCTDLASPIKDTDDVIISNDGKYLYISSNIYTINPDKNLASCSISNKGVFNVSSCNTLSYPTQIKGISLGSNLIYLAGNSSGLQGQNIASCTLESQNLTGNCTGIITSINTPQAAPTITNNNLFYTLSLDYPQSNIQSCAISSKTGILIDCHQTGGIFGDNSSWAGGLAIDNRSKFAYILVATNNHINDTINICPISDNGEISSNCITSQAKNNNGQNILTLNRPPFNPTIFNNTLFIPNNGSNTIAACPLNTDGSLGICVVSNLAQGASNPNAIAIF